MTREEAIEVLKDIYNYTRFDTYTTNEARTMAIKSLEQKPIGSVLDEIRADIVVKVCHFLRLKNKQRVYGLEDAFEIIDKYKTESEAAEQ